MHKDDDSSSDSSEDILRQDSEGWEDAELDEEVLQVKDFFSDKIFPDALSMINYCTQTHGFDFLRTRKDLGVYVSSATNRKSALTNISRTRLLRWHQACQLSANGGQERKQIS